MTVENCLLSPKLVIWENSLMLGVVMFWIFKMSPLLLGPGSLRRYCQDNGCLDMVGLSFMQTNCAALKYFKISLSFFHYKLILQ